MSKKNHPRGERVKEFCATPGTPPCDCKKNYITICRPAWASIVFRRKRKRESFDKAYEAHHILCVSPVNEAIVNYDKISKSVSETVWCINSELNMIAMPLWGHNVIWYETNELPPEFANLPQHDWDHNGGLGYTKEVLGDLRGVALDVEKEQCNAAAVDLAVDLNNLSIKWKAEIQLRGRRAKGTHSSWNAGKSGQTNWCEPFSMASAANIAEKTFPLRDFHAEHKKMMDRIKNAILGVG